MNKYSLKKLGGISFLTGVFFLPSTLFVGGIFLLISATVGTYINKKEYLSDILLATQLYGQEICGEKKSL